MPSFFESTAFESFHGSLRRHLPVWGLSSCHGLDQNLFAVLEIGSSPNSFQLYGVTAVLVEGPVVMSVSFAANNGLPFVVVVVVVHRTCWHLSALTSTMK